MSRLSLWVARSRSGVAPSARSCVASLRSRDHARGGRGWEATSRLSCQARMGSEDLVIEIPRYTINYEREGGKKEVAR